MATETKTRITVEATINAPVQTVWNRWNEPRHITQWCFASDDWHAPRSENDLRKGGKMKTRMEAKDGSMGFDFEAEYTNVRENELIEYVIADGREVQIKFIPQDNKTKVVETFEAEGTNPVDMQRAGWQAILDNFRKYTEASQK